LLEKAYAKLHGGYDQLIGGHCREALSNLTGGVTETYDLSIDSLSINYNMLLKSFNRSTLMNCAIHYKREAAEGLLSGHAYSITKVVVVVTANTHKRVPLLRIRNPWGKCEWKGAWSDRSSTWDYVTPNEKARIKLHEKDDGEFFMSFNDFIKHFDALDICNLTPDMLNRAPREDREWKTISFTGVWRSEDEQTDQIHTFELVDPDEDDDENFCSIVVSLLHIQNHRKNRRQLGIKIHSDDGELVKNEAAKMSSRESVFRYDLKPGLYDIEPYGEVDFKYMMRIFYEVKTKVQPKLQQKVKVSEVKNIVTSRPPNKTIVHTPPVAAVQMRHRPIERTPEPDCCCISCCIL
jgi:hypothetical protein